MTGLGYAVCLVSTSSKGYRVQAGGSSVHVWGAFHSGVKSSPVLPNRYLTSELYRGILQYTLVPLATGHFGDNYCYQDNNATPHCAQIVLSFSRATSSIWSSLQDCNPIEHIWDELGCAITSMDNLLQNRGELHQTLLDQCTEIREKRLQHLVASISRRLMAIIAARGGKTR